MVTASQNPARDDAPLADIPVFRFVSHFITRLLHSSPFTDLQL
jgi:hypothetical protein